MAWEKELLGDDCESTWAAMQKVGQGLAAQLRTDFREVACWPTELRILVLAGKGHNGGDALLAAASLIEDQGPCCVEVLTPFSSQDWRPLTRRAWEFLQTVRAESGSEVRLRSWPDVPVGPFTVVLDGLLGMQAKLPLREPLGELVAWINRNTEVTWRAAVDLPTGLGEAGGDPIFRADATYATGLFKAPLLQAWTVPEMGRLRYLDIGFCRGIRETREPLKSPQLVVDACLDPLRRARPAGNYKNRSGHLWVVGGSEGFPGAVLLTVQAALHAGAGLVTGFVPASLVAAYAAQCPGAMWEGVPTLAPHGAMDPSALADRLKSSPGQPAALVAGPGLGNHLATSLAAVEAVASRQIPIILDASALDPEVVAAVRDSSTAPLFLTPHGKEFNRLYPAGGKGSPPGAGVKAYARENRVVVVLKGPPMNCLSDGENLWYAVGGGPILGRGGSGDILAGMLGALVAAESRAEEFYPLETAARAVYWHSLAAQRWAERQGIYGTQILDLLSYLAHP